MKTTGYNCRKLVEYLEGKEVGLDSRTICNMSSISPGILGRSVEQVKTVVNFLKKTGVPELYVRDLLRHHPSLLEYEVDVNLLAKGPENRVAIDIRGTSINVVYYRK